MRAITGAFVGAIGSQLTFVAALVLAMSFCGWDEACTDDARRTADVAGWAGALGGLTVTALVYAGLLRLQRRPRPWSVVVPAVALTALLFAVIPGIWQTNSVLYLPAAAFAVAGVVTGFEWRRILRAGAR
jgi:uncharacterized membrane protein